MGKKKIALVDLSQSETPQLKATGVRSQKLNLKKKDQPQEDMGTPIAKAQVELAKLNAGTIDFDVLVAEPTMMPKLAKFAKLLGPKGLMPNPKTGTISADPQATAKKLAGGAVRFKSENKAPLIHLVVGKLSFKEEALTANVTAAIKAIQTKNLTSLYLTASMYPSIKLSLT